MSSSTTLSLKMQPPSRKQSQEVAQRFTRKWSQDHLDSPLAQGLVAFTDQQLQKENYVLLWDGRDSLSRNQQIYPLDKQLHEMTAAWKDFQDELPEDERATRDSDPPSVTCVVTAIEQLSQKCGDKAQDEYGSAKDNFQAFCLTMDAHSELFSIFPNGDKYVSLLCGTITSIVKASVNHSKICEGFSNALVTLGSEMKFWHDQVELHSELTASPVDDQLGSPSLPEGSNTPGPIYKNEHVISIVAQLYTKVFSFLASMMKKWTKSKWKRFSNSFDQNFYIKYIQNPMEDLKRLSANLQREAGTLHHWDTKKILAEVLGSRKDYRNLQNHIDEKISEMQMRYEEKESERIQGWFDEFSKISMVLQGMKGQCAQMGLCAFELIESSGASFSTPYQLQYQKNTKNNALLSPQSTTRTVRVRQPSPAASPGTITIYTQDSLERASRNLEPYSPHNFPVSQLSRPRNQETSNNIFQRLQAWLTSADSEVLWVNGPLQTSRPSLASFAATHIVSMLEQTNVPIIAYYCDADQAKIDPLDELTSLVYSLIRQLVWHVPKEFSDKKDFSTGRFELLDGNPESLEEALSLLRDLLGIVPRLLFCVIDGLNMLELDKEEPDNEEDDDEEDEKSEAAVGGDTEKHITRLLRILNKYKKTKVLKGLIVTDGYSSKLSKDSCFDGRINVKVAARIKSGKRRAAKQQLTRLQYSDVGSSVAEDTGESDSED